MLFVKVSIYSSMDADPGYLGQNPRFQDDPDTCTQNDLDQSGAASDLERHF